MGISLQHLEQKKLVVGMNKLREAGIDVEQWLAMLDADPRAMQRLVAAWPGSPKETGIVYDANDVSRILGLTANCNTSVPEALEDEIVVYYGGWSLEDLYRAVGDNFMCNPSDFLRAFPFRVRPGYYRLLLPVPDSDEKSWDEQTKDYLVKNYPGFKPAPTIIALTAELVHLKEYGEDLLRGGSCRCLETLKQHATLRVKGGHVDVGFNGLHRPYQYEYLVAVRSA